MSVYAVWIDRSHAKLFEFSNEKMERRAIQGRHTDHHTHAQDSLDHKHQEWAFFKEVADQMSNADHVLVLGPGVAKHHFCNYLVEHVPALARKLVGCETVDHPTDNQIAALAKKFFKLGAAPA